jgi:hypothetical protein
MVNIPGIKTTEKNSVWVKTAGLAGLACGANIGPENSLRVEAVATKQELKS